MSFLKKIKSTDYANKLVVLILIIIISLINIVSTHYFFRIDLTNDKKYSISHHTKTIISQLDDIIYFKIYLHGDLPVEYKKLETEIKYLLNEFKSYSEYIDYDFIDISSMENEEYKYSLQQELYSKGIPVIPHRNQQNNKIEEFYIFPGALVSYKGNTETSIAFIKDGIRNDEQLKEAIEDLEYLFVNSIRGITTKTQQRIGLINGHNEVTNNLISSFREIVSEHYELIDLEINEQLLSLNNLDCIVINNPKSSFSEKDKFIIDQFIMNGGKSIWIMNGTTANMDSLQSKSETIVLPNNSRNLDDLLFKYGVRINTDIIQDLSSSSIPIATHIVNERPQFELFPWVFFPVINPKSQHLITKNINPIKTEFPSSIDTINNQVKKTILLQTSNYTKSNLTPILINLENETKINEVLFNQKSKNIAVLLSGPFESVFKNRLTQTISKDPNIKFKDSINNNHILVISDAFFIQNQFFQGQNLPLGLDQWTGYQFGNGTFILNSLEFMLNNKTFIEIRSKKIPTRLLDKQKIKKQKNYWQIINIGLPLIMIIIVQSLIFFLRRRKYNYI
ncbi:MAG: gliding motility-associated ABC transporter substrate-binding protein GldG [Flavobacteriales bacterium]|nr:gliding motility-associated ABC transporter substrate-binding protein GldG [Flavobacteriales bacterium]|tara:strand:+ start:12402 stop:14093 length:1692 start_codon:yes stop_codon:yes gene_type:complete